jgi:hypothetical protein
MNNGKGEVVLERVAGTNPQQEIVVPNLKYWQAQYNNGFRMRMAGMPRSACTRLRPRSLVLDR